MRDDLKKFRKLVKLTDAYKKSTKPAKLKKGELQEVARQIGVSDSGTKTVILDRIKDPHAKKLQFPSEPKITVYFKTEAERAKRQKLGVAEESIPVPLRDCLSTNSRSSKPKEFAIYVQVAQALGQHVPPNLHRKDVLDSLGREEGILARRFPGTSQTVVSGISKRACFLMLGQLSLRSCLGNGLLEFFVSTDGLKYLPISEIGNLLFASNCQQTRKLILEHGYKEDAKYYADMNTQKKWNACKFEVEQMIKSAKQIPTHVEEGLDVLPERIRLLVNGKDEDRRKLLSSELQKYGLKIRSDSSLCRSFINGGSSYTVHQVVAIMRVTKALFAKSHQTWSTYRGSKESQLRNYVFDDGLRWSEACDKVLKDISKMGTVKSRPIQCHKCGGYGHIARDCYQRDYYSDDGYDGYRKSDCAKCGYESCCHSYYDSDY